MAYLFLAGTLCWVWGIVLIATSGGRSSPGVLAWLGMVVILVGSALVLAGLVVVVSQTSP